jgi:hypothetical protein
MELKIKRAEQNVISPKHVSVSISLKKSISVLNSKKNCLIFIKNIWHKICTWLSYLIAFLIPFHIM